MPTVKQTRVCTCSEYASNASDAARDQQYAIPYNPEEDVKNALITFLGKFGRLKYLRPLYRALYTRDKETALKQISKYDNDGNITLKQYLKKDLSDNIANKVEKIKVI